MTKATWTLAHCWQVQKFWQVQKSGGLKVQKVLRQVLKCRFLNLQTICVREPSFKWGGQPVRPKVGSKNLIKQVFRCTISVFTIKSYYALNGVL